MTATPEGPKNQLQPGWVYPEVETMHPTDDVDYRDQGGPRLTYLWCQNEDKEQLLKGQSLYLGGEVGSDGRIYCIPGHAPQVLMIDIETDMVLLIGPEFPGKFKWLRGIPCGDVIYGIPCHAEEVLRIHVPTRTVSTIPIPYEQFYSDESEAKKHRRQEWKYHGGSISPIDGCIYTIPQSALHILRINPRTEACELVGPPLAGLYKWYGGVVGKQDGAVYGIPHNSAHVLRICPDNITLHGDFGEGGHKWHGASAAPNGDIVCVPANADTVLCIKPGEPEPKLVQLEGSSPEDIQTGRHRIDRKYKYLGAMVGSDGSVYCFPSGSEYVLQINSAKGIVRNVGPNILDERMERICQNKWQNGLSLTVTQSVFAIPLGAESVLEIYCGTDPPKVSTWSLPAPHKGLAKWEGGVVAPNGVIYCVPNNHKAVLRIEAPPRGFRKPVQAKQLSERPSGKEIESLMYRSGIPTLRSSAHRVKHPPKNRKHDPKPKDRLGQETGTTWLPDSVCREDVFDYDLVTYDLRGTLVNLLSQCNAEIVGTFRKDGEALDGDRRLEDLVLPTPSTWREVNGGQCESAQRYLSDSVLENTEFLDVFDRLVQAHVLPYLKKRLANAKAIDPTEPTKFYYQRPPTLRLQPGPAWAHVKAHDDAIYGHQNGELNFWVPLTDRTLNNVDLHCETKKGTQDYHPLPAMPGQIISFHGSSCKHYVNANKTQYTRVSLDFRVGVEGFFDPFWQMQGTTDDHGRHEVEL